MPSGSETESVTESDPAIPEKEKSAHVPPSADERRETAWTSILTKSIIYHLSIRQTLA